MNKAMQWLAITWPVLVISAAIVLVGLFLMSRANGVGALFGLVMVLFGLYWGYKGTTPERDAR